MKCPHCQSPLRFLSPRTPSLRCTKCGGLWHNFAMFEAKIGHEDFTRVISTVIQENQTGKTCPSCIQPMKSVKMEDNPKLDLCLPCRFVWFDAAEYDSLKRLPEKTRTPLKLHVDEIQPRLRVGGARIDILNFGTYLQAADQMMEGPIVNDRVIRNFPFFTYLIILLFWVVFLKNRGDLAELWTQHAFMTGQWTLEGLRRAFGSFFLFLGYPQLIATSVLFYFLSSDVEDVSPFGTYLILLFGGHATGLIAESLFSPAGTVVFGTSGGLYALAAYYAILFPNARVQFTRKLYGPYRLRHIHGPLPTPGVYARTTLPITGLIGLLLLNDLIGLAFFGEHSFARLTHILGGFVGFLMADQQKKV